MRRRGAAWPSAIKPVADTNLMPGMFTLNERVMCRRWASGDQAWNWNVGLGVPGDAGADAGLLLSEAPSPRPRLGLPGGAVEAGGAG